MNAAPLLTRVRVEDYKSIARCDVTLSPFTVLLGLNAAGKSNFLDALHFLRDALRDGPAEAVASRGGLDNVLRRVPQPTDTCSIAVDLRIPGPGPEDPPWRAHYSLTLARPDAPAASLRVRVAREHAELGLEDASPDAHFTVEDGVATDPADSRTAGGRLRPGSLYLPLLSVSEPYARLHTALTSMFFYEPDLATLRDARPDPGTDALAEDGRDLGAVLARLAPAHRRRVSDYASAIVPRLTEVSSTPLTGDYLAARIALDTGPDGAPREFRAESMSEGTIRAIGLLAALYQPPARDGRISLLAVEEPELALHPRAAGALYDALTEAAESGLQVLVTTQSGELLDRDEADLSAIRMVEAVDGLTTIGPADEVSRSIVRDGLATVGELMRSDQLHPEPSTPSSGNAPGDAA
ncbi:AAA family ATPase [Streptomyces sp. NPDC048172]|uniref:AAA family ATPase n=1 Tax=Streptomyces sp. NPDC048172 TaxID=3365505 RepID=UPI0037133A4A